MSTTVEAPYSESDEGLDLGRILGAFRRRRVLFGATVLVVTAAVAAITLNLSPRYSAAVTLLVEPQEVRIFDSKAVAEGLPTWQTGTDMPLATQVNILTSRGHARLVVDALDLTRSDEFKPQPDWWEHPAIASLVASGQELALLAMETLDQHLLTGVASGSDEVEGEVLVRLSADDAPARPMPAAAPVEHAVDRLLANLSVHRDGLSQAIVVRFSAGDPEIAAKVANTVANLYLERQVADKVAITAAAERWVVERVDALRAELLEAERRVERYRAANDLLEGRDGSLDSQQLASLNTQLIAARSERQVSQARLERIRQIQAAGGPQEALGEFASSPLIAMLRQQDADLQRTAAQLAQEYGAQHPRMLQLNAERAEIRRKLDDEVANIIRAIADQVTLAVARERAIEASLEEAKSASAAVRDVSVELRELERDAAARRAVYQTVLARMQEIQEQSDLHRPDARVLSSAAVPDRPSFPKRGLMLVAGFVGSLGLGVVMVTVAELLDRSLRSAREIERRLGLKTLALVPSIPRLRREESPTRYLVERPYSAYSEALNELATTHRPCTGLGEVLLVTSSLPGDGKTSLATSIAATAARNGRQTILVDLDLRRPSVEPALGLAKSSGLSAHLVDGRPLPEVLHVAAFEPNLHVLGNSGATRGRVDPIRPRSIHRLLEQLRGRYDLVVVDSAPMLGLADTKNLATMADRVLFVVRWGKTPEAAARSALDALRSVDAPVAGAVLTQVDLARHARFGYGDGASYYRHYEKYYSN
jgi:succinoglycan biosynthesis transport protein ExoP